VNDKQILITGATNGIGLAAAEAARRTRREPRHRSVAARREPALRRLASGRRFGKGATVATFIADLSSQGLGAQIGRRGAGPAIQSWMCSSTHAAMYGTRQLTKERH